MSWMITYPVLHIGGPLHGQRRRMPSPDYDYTWTATPQEFDLDEPPAETSPVTIHVCRYAAREYRRRDVGRLFVAVDTSFGDADAERLLLELGQP